MATEAQIKITIDSSQATKSIDTLQADLKATRVELDRVVKSYGSNSKEADNLRRSVAALEVELGNLGVVTDEVTSSSTSLKTQLRQVVNEMNLMAEQGQDNTQRFQELAVKAGQLRDQIADTNMMVTQMAGNAGERLFNAVSKVTQVGVAGFQVMSSSMQLLGIESEGAQQSLAKMMAVMNLAQGLGGLAELPDTIKSIKTNILSLIPNFAGLAAAETGAAGATTLLGTAMNALPIVAIVAGITAIGYGLYKYMETSNKTKKIEEERVKVLQEQREEQKKQSEEIANESGEFIMLVEQIKLTNKNSRERKTLLKQINDTYGTTLQNLSDETAFQAQLNLAVEEYIRVQTIKVKMQANEAEFKKLVLRQQELEKEQALAAGDAIRNQIDAREQAVKGYRQGFSNIERDTEIHNKNLNEKSKKAAKQREAELAKIKNQITALAGTNLQLSNEQNQLTENNKKYVPQLDKTVKGTKDATDETDKYRDALEKLKDGIGRVTEFEKQRQKLLDSREKDPFQKQLQSTIDFYENEQKQVIDRATENELKSLDKKFEEGKIKEDQYQKDRQSIITNGYKFLTEDEKKFYNELDVFRNEDIQSLVTTENTKQAIIVNKTKEIQATTALLELEFQKKQELEAIDIAGKTQEQVEQEKLNIKKKYAQQEIDLIKSLANQQQVALNLALQQTLQDETKTANEKKQAEEQYSQDSIKLAQDTADKINKINEDIKPPVADKDKTLKAAEELTTKIGEYIQVISSLWNQLASAIQTSQEETFRQRQEKLDEDTAAEKEKLDEQLKNAVITREQYDAEIKRLDDEKAQKEKEMKMKAFEQNRKINIVNATINGAQAVLSTFAQMPGELIAKSIAAGIAAAFAATQIGIIANQQFPGARRGDVVDGMGSGEIDSVPYMLAPGETVINSKSSKMFPSLLSTINEAGGGKKLTPDLPPITSTQITPSIFQQQQSNQPIRAYVVETDVSDVQKRVNRIKRSVEF